MDVDLNESWYKREEACVAVLRDIGFPFGNHWPKFQGINGVCYWCIGGGAMG